MAAPVRVRLKRLNCNEAIPYPPDGQAREWWHRLKNALGTASSAFVGASLQQLIAAARLPNSGISEIAVNASLAFIEGAKPQGEVESALVLQMACTHAAAMAVLSRLAGGHGPDRTIAARGSAAARLLRAYAAQVDTWRRLRNGGSQTVRVEHVYVNDGGQAIIGNAGAFMLIHKASSTVLLGAGFTATLEMVFEFMEREQMQSQRNPLLGAAHWRTCNG